MLVKTLAAVVALVVAVEIALASAVGQTTTVPASSVPATPAQTTPAPTTSVPSQDGAKPALQKGKLTSPDSSSQDYSKEAFVIERLSTKITEEDDGTGTREIAAEVKMLAEAGVKAFAVLSFTYTSANEAVDVRLRASTQAGRHRGQDSGLQHPGHARER